MKLFTRFSFQRLFVIGEQTNISLFISLGIKLAAEKKIYLGQIGLKQKYNAPDIKKWNKWKIMTFIVANNVVASRPPERQPTGMPTTCANTYAYLQEIAKLSSSWKFQFELRIAL